MERPYRGLQPYTENDEDLFFGRDAEKAILIDKILADKLTLLFAASGVGKSSLLQAAVMPELKRPNRENLDVVYYNDWVTPPLQGLTDTIIETLQGRGKIDETVFSDTDVPKRLQDLLTMCATFTSEPFVIILDQFEEFFQYQRYTAHFTFFIEQLSDAIRDRATPVTFLISMREDFALNLNAFKGYLPNTLFENYYRLEKLEVAEAKAAIAEPVKRFDFRYEEGLLDELLNDLAEQERENRIGTRKEILPEHAPKFVEPPNVQIVCEQLWELEHTNPQKIIRFQTYNQQGKAKGFIDAYFKRVIDRFSPQETRIASKAFDHLVTPRGTKMAYPTSDLGELIREKEPELEAVLKKLTAARVLRSQSRKNVLWYELYHDIFSDSISRWNSGYKIRQRMKKAGIMGVAALAVITLLVVAYDGIQNFTNHHLRLNIRERSANIELYQGKAGSWDLFNLQRFLRETRYGYKDIEPDKRFQVEPVGKYPRLNIELIQRLPLEERIVAYWQAGEQEKALDLAQSSIDPEDMTRSQKMIDTVVNFRSQKAWDGVLKPTYMATDDISLKRNILSSLAGTPFKGTRQLLLAALNDTNDYIRRDAAIVLGELGAPESVEPLIKQFSGDQNSDIRSHIVKLLGELGDPRAIEPLVNGIDDLGELQGGGSVSANTRIGWALSLLGEDVLEPVLNRLNEQDSNVRQNVIRVLGILGDTRAVDPLIGQLNAQEWFIRQSAVEALRALGDARAVEPLFAELNDPHGSVRWSAALALGVLKQGHAVETLLDRLLGERNYFERQDAALALSRLEHPQLVESLLTRLKDSDAYVREGAAAVLGIVGDPRAVEPLIALLNDQDSDVRRSAALALGALKDERAITPLFERLVEQDEFVREKVVWALGEIGDESLVEPLLAYLKSQDATMRRDAAIVLGALGDVRAVEPLLALLNDQRVAVRASVAWALGKLGDARAVEPLLARLTEQEDTVRQSVINALGMVGDVRAVEPLLARSDQSYQNVAWALGKLGDVRAVEPLLARGTIFTEQDAWALGRLGDARAVEPLLRRLNKSGIDWYYDVLWVGEDSVYGTEKEPVVEWSSKQCGDMCENEENIEPGIVFLESPTTRLVKEDMPASEKTAWALGILGSSRAVKALLARLDDQDANVRQSAALALGELGDVQAVEPLILLLKDWHAGVRKYAAISLGRLADQRAIIPLQTQLQQDQDISLTLSAVLLRFNRTDGLSRLQTYSTSRKVAERQAVAEALGNAPSLQGDSLLEKMLDDRVSEVRKAVIRSLGKALTVSAIPALQKLLSETNIHIRKAVTQALTDMEAAEALPVLQQIALNQQEVFAVRKMAIEGLERLDAPEAVQALLAVLDQEQETALAYPAILALGNLRSAETLPALRTLLKSQERRRPDWRKVRDEDTSAFDREQTDEQKQQMAEWEKRKNALRPDTALELALGRAFAMIDPAGEGLKLLSYDLANVRQGAWIGLAKLRLTETKPYALLDGPGDVALLDTLIQQRRNSDDPLFKYAAYRDIDGMLITLETYGGNDELAVLNQLEAQPYVQEQDEVLPRVQWTVRRLEEWEEE